MASVRGGACPREVCLAEHARVGQAGTPVHAAHAASILGERAATYKGSQVMKVTVEIDCTPDEARQFMGLPDVKPLQAAVMAKL